MNRKLFTLVFMTVISCCCFAQALIKLGDESVPFSGVSDNGKWAYVSLDGFGTVFYDLDKRERIDNEGPYFASDASDNGIFVGASSGSAAYYKGGRWVKLPLPKDGEIIESVARGISMNGEVISGFITFAEGARKPFIWNLQSDGTYSVAALPCPETDFTGRVPQGFDALFCSSSGNILAGRLDDWTGMFSLPIFWDKDSNGDWRYNLLGMDIQFKEGVVLPTIPDPKQPEPMAYFTAADSAKYKSDLADFDAGIIDQSPEWHPQDFITNQDSINAYNTAAIEYNEIMEIVREKTGELYNAITNKSIDGFSLVLSANGRYLGATCAQAIASDNPGPLTLANEEHYSPLSFDLEKGEWTLKEFVSNGMLNGITDNGDLYYSIPNMEVTKTSYIIPVGTNDNVEFSEWIKQKSDGALDIKPDFLFTYSYEDPSTGEYVEVMDTLIVGAVFPSANGRIFMGTFANPENGSDIAYFIDLDGASSVKDISDRTKVVVYPNPATDILYINGEVESVKIVDLSGRTMYESSAVSGSIPVSSLGAGTYLVKVTSAGETTTHKVLVTK